MYIPILVSLKMSMKIARLRYNVNDAFLNVWREALESARADLCISWEFRADLLNSLTLINSRAWYDRAQQQTGESRH